MREVFTTNFLFGVEGEVNGFLKEFEGDFAESTATL